MLWKIVDRRILWSRTSCCYLHFFLFYSLPWTVLSTCRGPTSLMHTFVWILLELSTWWVVTVPTCISLAGAATSIIFVATKVLLRQTRTCPLLPPPKKIACRDKIFLSWHNFFSQQILVFVFIATKRLSRKHTFVVTNGVFCCYKHVFVATKVSLSRQTFVVTKMILVAAPANGTYNCCGTEFVICVWNLFWQDWLRFWKCGLFGSWIAFFNDMFASNIIDNNICPSDICIWKPVLFVTVTCMCRWKRRGGGGGLWRLYMKTNYICHSDM